MKAKTNVMIMAIMALVVLVTNAQGAVLKEPTDKTLSPYFFVKSDDPETDRLPLKSTSVKVDIAGVIADVKVFQVYKNEGKRPLEAIYVFPASTRAAVYGMKMTIGKRTITAKIERRKKAREQYEQAKKQGKTASLLEQQRPNVFQMNVANILPSDVIKVELKYTELLVPEDAIYEFVYPTVVGPRYSNQPEALAPSSEKWIENPYLHQGESPSYTFDASINISAGLPIEKIFCPSHKVDTAYEGTSFASIRLNNKERYGGNRDFILRYRLSGGKIQSGLILSKGEKEKFFLLMMQPPERVTNVHIPGREYIFIVDVSGSMHGFPLDISKKLMKDLVGGLRPTDRFNVLLFAGNSSVMAERPMPATPSNIRKAIQLIERQRGGGGTELLPALKRAFSMPRPEGFSRSIVIATDGYVSVEKEAFDLIRNKLGDANMFAFGIGTSVNRHIIEGMAHVGMGEPFVITRPDEAREKAERFRKLINSPVLTDIRVDYGAFDVYDVEPAGVPDVLAERPVIVFGKWQGKPKGTITVKGISGKGPYKKEINVADAKPMKGNLALRYLWARKRIELLADYNMLSRNDERIEEVTKLGLFYNLLTDYTSFVAIDSEVRLKDGKAVTVKQPLPLPQGVSDLAVGGRQHLRAVRPMAPGKIYSKNPLPASALYDAKAFHEASGSSEMALLGRPKEEEKSVDKKRGGYININKITVTEGLSNKDVKQLIETHIPSIEACIMNNAVKAIQQKGLMEILIKINPDGHVAMIKVNKDGIKSKALRECVIKCLKEIVFPLLKGGKQGVITVEFMISK